MALSDDDQALISSLDRELALSRKQLVRYDRYLEGEQPLKYMAPALEAEVGALVTQVVINWPMMVVDAFEHRLDVTGFRYPGDADRDPEIWAWWDQVDGDEQSQQAHFEALALGRCYAIVGSGDEDGDPPVLSIEHPLQVVTRRDPRTRETTAALKRWKDDDKTQRAQLYTPDATVTLSKKGRSWEEDERDDHQLGVVTVVPLVHKGRMMRPNGRSLFHDIIPIADAANKMATDMMVSGEFHAMPRRWALGFSEEDFVDEHGRQLDTWSRIAGRVWASEKGPKEAAVGQFPEADLGVFHNTIRLFAQLVVQLIGLPMSYLGMPTDNPASADAMRASEARMIKGAERMTTPFGGSWKQVSGLFLRIKHGEDVPNNVKSLTTTWRDPATPTRAQMADATVKLTSGDNPILDPEQGRIDLGYDEEQRRRIRAALDEARVPTPPANAGA
jgi:hypothetical protein